MNKANFIEKTLNNIRIDHEIGLGEFVGIFLQLSLNNRNKWILFLASLRYIFFPKGAKLNLYEKMSNKKDKGKEVLIGAVSPTERSMSFFNGIIQKELFKIVLTYSGSGLNQIFIQKKTIDGEKVFIPFKYLLKVLRCKQLGLYDKIISLGALSVQWSYYETWKQLLIKYNYQLVISDFDRYTSNAPLILAARSLGICTISLIHGATNPISNYLPLLADNLFVWGKYHIHQFKNVDMKRLHITGNPKIKQLDTRTKNTVNIIGLAMTKLPLKQRNKFITTFLKATSGFKMRVVKIHPLEEIESYSKYDTNHNNLEIFPNENAVDDFLEKIDVLCVRRSQLGSDALGFQIPIIILDGINPSDLQNGEILASEAGCPIVHNSDELLNELLLLKNDVKYRISRINQQNGYFKFLYTYIDKEANNKMIQKINEFIN